MEEFDIRRLFEAMWAKKLIILLIIILFTIIGIVYAFYIKQPIYTSKTRIALEKNDVSASEYVKSDIVLTEAVNNIAIEGLTIEKLKSELTVTYNKETRIIQIQCENENNNYAAKIVSEVTNIYLAKLDEVYEIKNARLIEEAKVQNKAQNINKKKDIATFILIGIVVSGLYILIISTVETSLKTVEEIEALNINVLGIVPNYEKGSEE